MRLQQSDTTVENLDQPRMFLWLYIWFTTKNLASQNVLETNNPAWTTVALYKVYSRQGFWDTTYK